MPYIRCPEDCEYVARLSAPVLSVKSASGWSNQVDVYTVLEGPYDVLPVFKNFGGWGRDCNFKPRVRTRRLPMLAGWHNVKLSAVPPSDRHSLYASVPHWLLGCEFRRKLHDPSPPVRSYFFYHIFPTTDLREDISRIAVCEFDALFLFSFLGYAGDYSCSRRAAIARTRFQGSCGVPFPILRRGLSFVHDVSFIKWFDDSSFDLAHAFLAFGRSQEVN